MTYSLNQRALASVLCVEDDELRQLLSGFEWLAQDPVTVASGSRTGRTGSIYYVCEVGRFTVTYAVSRSGRHITIFDVLLTR